jgi:hypothetical protein
MKLLIHMYMKLQIKDFQNVIRGPFRISMKEKIKYIVFPSQGLTSK